MPNIKGVTRENCLDKLSVEVFKKYPKCPLWNVLFGYYSVCIVSMITPFSRELYDMHKRIGGLQNETFESYQALPCMWVHACDVMNNEIARINKARQEKEERQNKFKR